MADGFETKTGESVQGRATAPRRPPVTEVSFDSSTGSMASAADRVDRAGRAAEVLSRAQARLDNARGGPVEAVQMNEHGAAIAPATSAPPDEPAPEPEATEEPGEPTEIDATGAPVEPAAAEPAPVDEPAAAAATETAREVQMRLELEAARADLAEARHQAESWTRGQRDGDFDLYHDDPRAWLRARVAEVLGVDAKDPLVDQEEGALFGELTYATISAQDLPEPQQATLRAERVDRKLRLQSHRRQATQRAQQSSQIEERARHYATSVFDTVAAQFPAARLAERRYGRPIGSLIVDRLQRGLREGTLQNWQTRDDADLFTEAIRLLDNDSRQWAQTLGPQLAPLISAPAPGTPGASSQPAPPQTPKPSPAPTTGATAKPRTLPPKQAGAAPSRPGAPPTQEPLSRDPEIRKRQILARYGNRP